MHHKPRLLVLAALFSLLSANTALAGSMAHMHHAKPAATSSQNAQTRAYVKAMNAMHAAMQKPLSGNVDVDFARQMIPHHQGALAMAEIQQKYGHDARLKQFNDWVIFAQTIEIGFMKHWLYRRDNGAADAKAHDYFAEAMKAMHHRMNITYTGDADVDYVRGMIAHHQGAVDMASILLAAGTDPELNDLANDIIASQTYEIAWLKRWLAARGLKAE